LTCSDPHDVQTYTVVFEDDDVPIDFLFVGEPLVFRFILGKLESAYEAESLDERVGDAEARGRLGWRWWG
jgi:hypothetical protein